MTTMPEELPKAPYLSFTTFKNFIVSLGEAALPSRVDKSVMVGQSGGTQSYLMSAMRFFDLIDATGAPQPSLRRLAGVAKNEVEFRKVWREIVEPAYAPILKELDIKTSTTAQLHEILKNLYSYGGDTLRKSHVFFLAALEAAGIEAGAHMKVAGRVGPTRKRTRPNQQPQTPSAPVAPTDPLLAQDATGKPTADIASLKLDPQGSRIVRLQGPSVVTKSELDRIQQWMSFHFIVVDKLDEETQGED